MSLKVGDRAPDFDLSDTEGHNVSLHGLEGTWVVLYFYPRDHTPGCTKEACAFRDIYGDYQSRHAVVLGVSTDDAKSHAKFVAKFQLPFRLLCDPNGTVATAYESYGLKKFMGKEYTGITRNTFLIDPTGKIAKIYLKVKPETHPGQVIADIDALIAQGG